MPGWGAVWSQGGGCLVQGVVFGLGVWSRGGCLLWGSGPGGCLLPGVPPLGGGASLGGGGGIPACTEADPLPCEQNDKQV